MNKTTVVFIIKMLRLLFYMSEYKFLFNVTFLSNLFDNVLILRYLVNLTYELRIQFIPAWKGEKGKSRAGETECRNASEARAR